MPFQFSVLSAHLSMICCIEHTGTDKIPGMLQDIRDHGVDLFLRMLAILRAGEGVLLAALGSFHYHCIKVEVSTKSRLHCTRWLCACSKAVQLLPDMEVCTLCQVSRYSRYVGCASARADQRAVRYIFTWFSLCAATSIMLWMVIKRPPGNVSRRIRHNAQW